MHYDNPFFEAAVERAADRLMQSYTAWRNEMALLILAGEESDFFMPVDDLDEMQHAFQAVAERLVMEDIYSHWEWINTTWLGINDNTGHSAYIIDFVSDEHSFPDWATLSFFVTSNRFFWFAIPLVEPTDTRHQLSDYEVNSVRQAISMCVE